MAVDRPALAGLVATTVSAVLTLAAWQFVSQEAATSISLAFGVPRIVLEAVMPAGFRIHHAAACESCAAGSFARAVVLADRDRRGSLCRATRRRLARDPHARAHRTRCRNPLRRAALHGARRHRAHLLHQHRRPDRLGAARSLRPGRQSAAFDAAALHACGLRRHRDRAPPNAWCACCAPGPGTCAAGRPSSRSSPAHSSPRSPAAPASRSSRSAAS